MTDQPATMAKPTMIAATTRGYHGRMKISDMGRATGVDVDTIRDYEKLEQA